jgi:hypothetical protein
MSVTETPEPVKPVHKRTNRRRKKRRAPKEVAPPEPTGEFVGLTPKECPTACNADRCVISGAGVCGHPYKGAPQVHSADALTRFNEAKKFLGKRKVDLGSVD